MENKIVFREMLSEIKKEADAAGGWITKEEIHRLLAALPLEEEHFQMIYKYLGEQNIRVLETEEEADEAVSVDENRSLSLYLEELEELAGQAPAEEQELFRAAFHKEPGAKEQLITWYLPLICEMAGEYEGEELLLEDLIQEGNVGLLMAMETADGLESPAAYRAHLLNGVSQAMEQAIGESRSEHKKGEGIAGRVNHLNEAVKNLEEDLEHKVSVEELSAYLEMPVEEIRDILRMSGDQIEIEKENKL